MTWNPPTMRLTSTYSTATTYSFIVPESLGGWAIATVNDATGELLITSDWGNWSHQWSTNPKHLGAANLTAFIAHRNAVDYLAGKLNVGNGRRAGEEFDADETVIAIMKDVVKQRLKDGREQLERANNGDGTLPEYGALPELSWDYLGTRDWQGRQKRRAYLTASAARDIQEKLRSIVGDTHRNAELFLERVYEALARADLGWLINEPWEYLQYRQTYADRVLRESILPALIEACRQTEMASLLVAAHGPQAFEVAK